MSSTLYWEPLDRNKHELSDVLKFALQKKYGGIIHDTLRESDIPYLEGLRDAGVAGAEQLIAAIKKHEAIIVVEEF